jgi:hypothetical protein
VVGECTGTLEDVCVPPLVVLVLWWEVGVGFGDTLVEVLGVAVVEAGGRHAPA